MGVGFILFAIWTNCLGLVTASILAYGAHTRNSSAMLIYMGGAILIIILNIVGAVLRIKSSVSEAWSDLRGTNQTDTFDWGTTNQTDISHYQVCGTAFVGFAVVIGVGFILFDIWSITVAKNAKKEIEDEK